MRDASLGRRVIVIPASARWRVHRPRAGPWTLAGLGLLTAIAATIGALASASAQGFYLDLVRPAWAPPPAVFGPVWTVLYAMMAVATWLVMRRQKWPESASLVGFYGVHLVVNALWTWCFFAWQSGVAATVDIAMLWVLVALLVVLFGRVEKWAAILLLPYLAWVTYAFALTFTVWRMNPQVL